MNNMISKDRGKGVNRELMIFHEMMNNAEDCISSLQNAFFYNKLTPIKDCKSKISILKRTGADLTQEVKEKMIDDPDLKPYSSIPENLLKIVENTEKLVEFINKKIIESLLFSDKAVRESTFLLQRLIEILRPTSDIILARNIFLSMYVQESQVELEKSASGYATLHEDRLIKGICNPAASSLYINMLSAIKNIAWHSKEITVKLGGL
jgi:hypothetical protein